MNVAQHTCATLFAVALAGEENYWLCEPATSRPLQSDWKSTPCRWLYPVDISLDRFAKMSGFDTTDSVFELGMEGVSRVEKYATLACDIKAKRQKENGTVYFFVPHQEIARIDERYKLLLKKEQQELQRQFERKHQQLEEKPQKQNTDAALQQVENEKCSMHIEVSSENGKEMPNNKEYTNLTHYEEKQQPKNVESTDSTLQNIPNHESTNRDYLSFDAQFEEERMEERKVGANIKVERVDLSEIPIKQEITEENDKKYECKSTTAKRRRKNLSSASSHLTKKNRSTCGQRSEAGEGNKENNPFTWTEYYVLRRKRGNAYLCKYAIGNSYGYRLTKIEHHPFTLFILFGSERHNYFNVNVNERCIPVSSSAVLNCNNSNNNIDSVGSANDTATSDKGNNFVTHSREYNNEHSVLVLVCNEEAERKKENCHALEHKLANDKNSKLLYNKFNQRSKQQKFEREEFEEELEWDQNDEYNESKELLSEESQEEEELYLSNEEWERSEEQHPHQELEEEEEEEEELEEFEELEHYNSEDNEEERKAGSRRRAYRSDKNASRLIKRSKTERNQFNDNKKQSNYLERSNRQTFSKNGANMTDQEDLQKFTRAQYVNYPNELKEAAVLETVGVNMWSDAVESVPTAHEMTLQHPFGHDETKDYNTAIFPDGTCVTYTPASYARVMAKREQILQEKNNTSHTTDRTSSKFTESEVDGTLGSPLDFAKTHNDTKEDVISSKKSNVQTNYNQKHGATAQGCNDDDDMRVLLNNIELAKEQINFDLHK